ncbi:PfkB family carbohydrate kinase [Rhizobiaceae bacterium n13]|uniref:PfkB family carbohydrate kinase n=1 Tax=Ferirhizobium litorale TaxID=2927786 RepID=A0AAE3QGN3_9HYPH|nr:PfkB family carbohydrate kinase [Fererhizobium litorale]MDI7861940.1 PfkB family carbohydrate kinase [Fererhizobium litorale]MDI7922788.1 PfkB family carbohydrate kinase [Fererhizobium litorale]
MMAFRFAAVGDNCIDRFLPPVGLAQVGGNAVNVAVQLARLGHAASYFGAVGDDPDGRRIRTLLAANGVGVAHVDTRPGNTAFTDIRVMPDGDRIMTYEDFGVCRGYAPGETALIALAAVDHVHIGWLDDGGELRRRLAAAGVSVSQDISVNADPHNLGVEGLAIAFASAGDDPAQAADRASDLVARGAKRAVVTMGPVGSLAYDGRNLVRVGIRPVEVVDTTGAGDSFIAGYLAAHVGGMPAAACLEAGRDRAAMTCTHVGGFPQQLAAI